MAADATPLPNLSAPSPGDEQFKTVPSDGPEALDKLMQEVVQKKDEPPPEKKPVVEPVLDDKEKAAAAEKAAAEKAAWHWRRSAPCSRRCRMAPG